MNRPELDRDQHLSSVAAFFVAGFLSLPLISTIVSMQSGFERYNKTILTIDLIRLLAVGGLVFDPDHQASYLSAFMLASSASFFAVSYSLHI